jgi:single-strand DNA-binding protein|nr:MAG TPA: Single strand binding protein [Caudoviricetes sp.]
MNINSVIMTGNLTRDPELRSTAGGTSVLRFSVAVNDRVKDSHTGEWEDRPNYIDCTMFGNRAESLARFLHKGCKVAVQGKLHWSSWEKDGQKRSKVEVWPDTVELLTPRQQKDSGTQEAESAMGVEMQPYYEEDIPF